MIKNFFSIIFLFLFLNACEYKPIFSTNETDFRITEFNLNDDNNISNQIVRVLKKYNNPSAKKNYTLELTSDKKKEVLAKDSKGNVKSYTINIICNFKIYSNKKILKSKIISKSFIFSNDDDKFRLKKYETIIERNLVNEIIKDLVLELYSS